MSRWLNVFTILLLVGFSSCDRLDCWGGTLESKDKPYQGDKTKTTPYADKPVLQMGPGSCDTFTKHCGYFPLAKSLLHNPTSAEVTADVNCKIFIGNWEAGKNKRTGVKVKAKGSKMVEIQFNIDIIGGQQSAVGIKCDVYWK